jgi:hypothetical protein
MSQPSDCDHCPAKKELERMKREISEIVLETIREANNHATTSS